MLKQKTKLLALCFVFLFSITSTALLFAPTAKADYTVPGGMCEDNKTTPTRSVDNGVVTLTCPESSRAAGANANGVGTGGGNTGVAAAGAPSSTSTCAIEGFGIVICPWARAAARMSDELFNILSGFFLAVQPELLNDESPTRDAWEQARNLANVAFVVAFVVLIYSQITGGLMSNYGIKRMLPRLIIAALAVNLSYIICQAMVDASNILGYNIKDALDVFTKELPPVMGSGSRFDSGGGVLSNIIALSAGVLLLAWPVLSLGTVIVTAALVTLITSVIILLLRKALLVLLVVVSPLAFVAYILPNTESLFKKWLSMFWGLLMLFPIIAALLGAGKLAGGIILNASIDRSGTSGNVATASQRACPEGQICAEDGFAIGGESQMYETGRGKAPLSSGLIAVAVMLSTLFASFAATKGIMSLFGKAGVAAGKMLDSKTRAGVSGAGGKIKGLYDKSDFAKMREHDAHHMAEAARLGNYHGPRWRIGRRIQSKINNRIRNEDHPWAQGLRAYKDSSALSGRQKEASDLIKAFDNDPDAMRVWNYAHGDLDTAIAFAASKGIGFNEDRQRAFMALAKQGAHHGVGSFLAANEGLVASGKGNVDDIIRGVLAAADADPSVSIFGELEKARSGSLKSGRADINAHLEKLKERKYDRQVLETFMQNHAATDSDGKTYGADMNAMKQSISDMGVAKLHYEAFKADETKSTSEGMDKDLLSRAFVDRMPQEDNWAGVVKGLANADGRFVRSKFGGKNFEQIVLEEASRKAGREIKGIQEAINIVENRTSGMPRP